jgi:hypothetical protein
VLEATGTVTVAGKPLAKGATVAADDVVETGADGNVKIELAHNKAIWTLGPNKHEKVSASLAWTLAKNEGTAKPVDQDTSAAGRPAERSAADTSVTAQAPQTEEAARQDTAPAPAAAAAPPPTAAAAPEAEKNMPAPPPPPPPPDVQPSRTRAVVGGDALGVASGGGGAPPKSKSTAPSKKVEVAGEKYLKCLTGVTALHLVLHGQASGKTTYEVTGGLKLPADVKACVDKVTAGITLEAGAHADVDLTK